MEVMNMNTELVSIFINAAVTVFVAVLGWQQRVKRKDDEAYRELREKLEKEKEDAILKKKEEEEKRLTSIESNISELTKDVGKLQEIVKELTAEQLTDIKNQLKNLHTMESNNFVYIRSLSNVVVTIGEVLNGSSTIESKSKDKLDECIEEHKKKESDIHEILIKLIM